MLDIAQKGVIVKMRLTYMVLFRYSIYKNLSSDENLATTQDKYRQNIIPKPPKTTETN